MPGIDPGTYCMLSMESALPQCSPEPGVVELSAVGTHCYIRESRYFCQLLSSSLCRAEKNRVSSDGANRTMELWQMPGLLAFLFPCMTPPPALTLGFATWHVPVRRIYEIKSWEYSMGSAIEGVSQE